MRASRELVELISEVEQQARLAKRALAMGGDEASRARVAREHLEVGHRAMQRALTELAMREVRAPRPGEAVRPGCSCHGCRSGLTNHGAAKPANGGGCTS